MVRGKRNRFSCNRTNSAGMRHIQLGASKFSPKTSPTAGSAALVSWRLRVQLAGLEPIGHSCINSGNAELCGQAPPVFGLILPINQQNLPFLPDLKGDF